MTFVSYAQNFEDILLWRALHGVEPKTYLDIGAQDPVIDSVSLAFYQAGWRGTHVEPTPTYAEKLRLARPDETVIEAAISQSPGLLELHEFPDTGLSTGLSAIADKHVGQGYATRTILVPTLRLDELLERTGEVPWMKIDVEGMEADVLASWGESTVRPWVLIIEATVPNTQEPSDHEWRDMVLSRGYREAHFDGLSRYFVHEVHCDLVDRFSCPPNIFDGFQITAHHFSTAELSRNLNQHKQQVDELGQRLRTAETERDAANSAIILDGREHQAAIKRLQKEHQNSERLLHAQAAATEQGLKQALSALEQRLLDARAELTTLRAREGGHLRRIDTLRRDKNRTKERLEGKLTAANHLIDQAENERSELQRRVSEMTLRLEMADDLIGKALAEPLGLWQRLGRAIGIAGKDRARQALQAWEAHNPTSNARPVEPNMSIAPLVATDEFFPAASLAELLSLEGAQFVHVTYATILGREADPAGEAHYLERLNRGVPKIQIINEISQSPEGKLLSDSLPDLRRQLNRFRRASLHLGKQKAAAAIEASVVEQSKRPHVKEFMRYHDEEFVNVVFRYYLGRQPDHQGLGAYVAQLRSGISRQQVLLDVANSVEARKHGRWSFGQRTLAAILLIEKTPLLGTAFAAVRFNLLVRQHLRDVRAMQNHLYRLTQKIS